MDTEAVLSLEDMSFDEDAEADPGKLLAFINQLRASSDVVRKYFYDTCDQLGIKKRALKLWIRTRWGSLGDCFKNCLAMQKVSNSTAQYALYAYAPLGY